MGRYTVAQYKAETKGNLGNRLVMSKRQTIKATAFTFASMLQTSPSLYVLMWKIKVNILPYKCTANAKTIHTQTCMWLCLISTSNK